MTTKLFLTIVPGDKPMMPHITQNTQSIAKNSQESNQTGNTMIHIENIIVIIDIHLSSFFTLETDG